MELSGWLRRRSKMIQFVKPSTLCFRYFKKLPGMYRNQSTLWKAFNKQKTWGCWSISTSNLHKSVTDNENSKMIWGFFLNDYFRYKTVPWNVRWHHSFHSFCNKSRGKIFVQQLLRTFLKSLRMTHTSFTQIITADESWVLWKWP